MSARYYDNWKKQEDVDYEQVRAMPEENILYAGYTYEDYSGNAIVVFVEDGKLFENHDGHCSCNGLENWEPEETCAEAILMRPEGDWPGLHEAIRDWTGVRQ